MIVRETGDFCRESLYSVLDVERFGPGAQGVIVRRARVYLDGGVDCPSKESALMNRSD
jgi:hypothetical protein